MWLKKHQTEKKIPPTSIERITFYQQDVNSYQMEQGSIFPSQQWNTVTQTNIYFLLADIKVYQQ